MSVVYNNRVCSGFAIKFYDRNRSRSSSSDRFYFSSWSRSLGADQLSIVFLWCFLCFSRPARSLECVFRCLLREELFAFFLIHLELTLFEVFDKQYFGIFGKSIHLYEKKINNNIRVINHRFLICFETIWRKIDMDLMWFLHEGYSWCRPGGGGEGVPEKKSSRGSDRNKSVN